MLRTILSIRHNVNISNYEKLRAYLKRQNVGYKPKKSNVLSETEIEKFLNEAPIEYLPQKVALIVGISLGISGACRCDELLKMKMTDLEILAHRIIIVIPVTKTYSSRTFVITKPEWIKIVKHYYDLRNNVHSERFFLQIRSGRITKQPFGHNSIGNFPKKIAAFLKLENVNGFTGHCFRRTSATLLANTGGDILQLKRLGGWKSSTVAEGYVENSIHGQVQIANMLSHAEKPQPSTSAATSEIQQGVTLTVNNSDTANVTINVYNNSK
ncbi:uncharacterized protein LOC116176442 [Photinus pyralis]|uniref:uncharacterized protein LOC116176442 n=1 Tax=Photinus pyralis TaxID=7054 RepID=UPI001267689D|nr:uncharacterized protein LOC116176442 [Photinus pyralis]